MTKVSQNKDEIFQMTLTKKWIPSPFYYKVGKRPTFQIPNRPLSQLLVLDQVVVLDQDLHLVHDLFQDPDRPGLGLGSCSHSLDLVQDLVQDLVHDLVQDL